MNEFVVYADAAATASYRIKAENANAAAEAVEKMINRADFIDEFRKNCVIIEPKVSDIVLDMTSKTLVDRWENEDEEMS